VVAAVTERRRRPRLSELKGTLAILRESGMQPCALDSLPDGTYRWHFTAPPSNDETGLDRELAEFEARNGYGRA
jgi:hypothetical protein